MLIYHIPISLEPSLHSVTLQVLQVLLGRLSEVVELRIISRPATVDDGRFKYRIDLHGPTSRSN